MARPILKIELQPIDKLVEIIGGIGLVFLITLPIYYYHQLPDTIPIHYGINGEADRFGGKEMIWIIVLVGVLLYLLLNWLNKYPHRFNYLIKITSENAEKEYRIGTRVIRTLKSLISCFFAYLVYTTIQLSLQTQEVLINDIILILMLLACGRIVYFTLRSLNAE